MGCDAHGLDRIGCIDCFYCWAYINLWTSKMLWTSWPSSPTSSSSSSSCTRTTWEHSFHFSLSLPCEGCSGHDSVEQSTCTDRQTHIHTHGHMFGMLTNFLALLALRPNGETVAKSTHTTVEDSLNIYSNRQSWRERWMLSQCPNMINTTRLT